MVLTSQSHGCVLQALAGEVGMSSELDQVARALFNGNIPDIWRKLAPDTLKSLGNWMLHFNRRYSQYSSWVRAATPVLLHQYSSWVRAATPVELLGKNSYSSTAAG